MSHESFDCRNPYPEDARKWAFTGMGSLLFLVLCGLFPSCTTTRYIPVEKVVHTVKMRDSIRTDSIYRHDSIYFAVKGDTVTKYVSQTEYRYKYVDRRDTLCLTDTVRIERTVEVEKPQPWHAQMFAWIGKAALGLLALYGAILYLRHKRKAA